MKKILFNIFKFILTALVFWLIFTHVDVALIAELGRRTDWRFFLLGVALVFIGNFLWVLVTREILASAGIRLGYAQILKTNYHSYFFAFLGELVGGLSRWKGFSAERGTGKSAFVAIIMERFAIFLVLSLVYGALFVAGSIPKGLQGSMQFLYALGWILPAVSLVGALVIGLSRGVVLFPRKFFWAATILVLVVALSFTSTAIFFRSIGITLSWSELIWVADLVWIAQLVPITVLGLGVREGVLALLLSVLGSSAEHGVLAGLMTFLPAVILAILGGVWFMIDKRTISTP